MPLRIRSVSLCYEFWILGIPSFLCCFNFGSGCFFAKWRFNRGSLSCYCNKKSNLGFGLIYLSLDDTVILEEEKKVIGHRDYSLAVLYTTLDFFVLP
jgi:hypothetical protein